MKWQHLANLGEVFWQRTAMSDSPKTEQYIQLLYDEHLNLTILNSSFFY